MLDLIYQYIGILLSVKRAGTENEQPTTMVTGTRFIEQLFLGTRASQIALAGVHWVKTTMPWKVARNIMVVIQNHRNALCL